MQCKDLPDLEPMLDSQLDAHRQWTSDAIQNEILEIISDAVIKRIISDVRTSEYFGIIMDETSDVSKKEQVAICMSYVIDGIMKEAFVGFFDTKSTDGETLYELVKKVMKDLELDLQKIVGECFDGAANMKGRIKGLQALMKKTSPLALYVHCYAHLLNLALQKTLEEILPLRNTLGTIQQLYNFLEASPKRHAIFKDTEVDKEVLFKRSLKSLSITRWACRWEAVKAVSEELERVVKTLLKLTQDKDSKTHADARSLLNAICSFEFIFGLNLLKVILSQSNALSRYLQSKDMDVITARRNADLVMGAIKSCRDPEHFQNLWDMTSLVCKNIEKWIDGTMFNVKETRSMMRQPSKRFQFAVGETSNNNTEFVSPEEFHRINTYYTALDFVLQQLEYRFSGNDQDVLCALADILLGDKPKESNIDLVCESYGFDKDLLVAEHDLFTMYKADIDYNGRSASDLLTLMKESELIQFVPELYKALKFLCVIPATSCSAERAFSALRRLETYLRSTMGQDRLSHLAIICIEREYSNLVMKHDIDDLIDVFGSCNNRQSFFF